MSLGLIFATVISGLVILVGGANGQPQHPIDQLEILLKYCYEHASDSPNPVKDLLDKGLIPANFAGETCGSIKQAYDNEQIRITEEREPLKQKYLKFNECWENVTTMPNDCHKIMSHDEFMAYLLGKN